MEEGGDRIRPLDPRAVCAVSRRAIREPRGSPGFQSVTSPRLKLARLDAATQLQTSPLRART